MFDRKLVTAFGINMTAESGSMKGLLLVRDRAWNGDQGAEAVTSRPVAHVIGGREDVFDDGWDGVEAVIGLDAAQFNEEALYGLETFSHLEVVFFFNQVPLAKIETGARHPRGNADWPLVGIFAQRGKNRPNRLGVSRCRLHRVDGLSLYVSGLDAVAGTHAKLVTCHGQHLMFG